MNKRNGKINRFKYKEKKNSRGNSNAEIPGKYIHGNNSEPQVKGPNRVNERAHMYKRNGNINKFKYKYKKNNIGNTNAEIPGKYKHGNNSEPQVKRPTRVNERAHTYKRNGNINRSEEHTTEL